jgi:hypothetical protein
VIVPFLRRADQRRDFGDPRPSLAERYETPENYSARVRTVADGMVKAGLLLDEDAQRIIARATRVQW